MCGVLWLFKNEGCCGPNFSMGSSSSIEVLQELLLLHAGAAAALRPSCTIAYYSIAAIAQWRSAHDMPQACSNVHDVMLL